MGFDPSDWGWNLLRRGATNAKKTKLVVGAMVDGKVMRK